MQSVAEEYLLTQLGDTPALFVMGWEGVWGLAMSTVTLLVS